MITKEQAPALAISEELRKLAKKQAKKANADIMVIERAATEEKSKPQTRLMKIIEAVTKKKSQTETVTTPRTEMVTIPEYYRYQGLRILGPTGVARSVLLLNMITQDIANKKVGVCVIEPFADLVRKSAEISEKIGRKYYYINPEYEHTHSFNPLDTCDDGDIERVANANEEVFLAWLDKETHQFYKDIQGKLFNISIKALKYAKGNEATYKDLNDLLNPSNNDFRVKIISVLEQKLDKHHVVLQGIQEYHMNLADNVKTAQVKKNYKDLYAYLSSIINNECMARIICRKSTFSLREVIEKGEHILMSTGFRVLGRELSSTLGRLMLALLKKEAFERLRVEERKRSKFPLIALYADEYQNYIFDGLRDLRAMTRKSRFCMCIAHQDLAELRAYEPKFAKFFFDTTLHKIVFDSIDHNDWEFVTRQMGIREAVISNLSIYRSCEGGSLSDVLCKIVTEQDFFNVDEYEKAGIFMGLVKPMFPLDFFRHDNTVVLNAKTLKINGAAERKY